MKKTLQWLLVLLGMVAVGTALTAQADNLNYAVTANLPENQINDQVSYFDLKVKPGQKQDLTIQIKNNDEQAHRYQVSPNLAVTNDNGVIDYSQAKAKADQSLKFNLKTALSAKQTVTVPAKSAKTVTIKLALPTKAFDGIALGGINVVQELADQNQQSGGVALQNQYAYVIGLQLREKTTTNRKPNMRLHAVKARQLNYRNYVTANLQNDQPVIMRHLKIKSTVTKAGKTKPVLTTTKENLSMAPNSNFNFAIGDGQQALQPGKYTLHLTAKADEGQWKFTKNFTISNRQAKKLNDTSVATQQSPNYLWWFVGLGAVIVLLLALVIWLILRNRRRDQ
ncbi:DUF916 and DUF3324 domain-containing protein [Lactiplantibacillus modestisalitolerans]|uniref:DUF916 and DUF3324 domain-containing protein n=1 Tax=Lactiplantibacillus modestisalitolerans TaxID=1457219 RepID=A0ABV5WS88_9LACO|nr:DUF916 and DUF3324 domain-containing protein [Lactiplantibacillus modestisalitolerans]